MTATGHLRVNSVRGGTFWIGIRRHAEDIDNAPPEQWSKGGANTSRRAVMPKLTVEGVGEFEVPAGKRLVLALVDEAGVAQLHACGGNAACTTCRVEFVSGEPDKMTEAEKAVL